MAKVLPVLLSGGSGTRLWPVSRELFPKQLQPLLGGPYSLLQETARRASGSELFLSPLVVCNEEHRFAVASQLDEAGTPPRPPIIEPVGRNTAPAIAAAALVATESGEDPILLVLPSDHFISDQDEFLRTVARAMPAAEAGHLVLFGIVPSAPESGYGYIKRGEAIAGVQHAFTAAHFVEKPEQARAEQLIAAGGYYWNSGIFLFRASAYLTEMARYAPDMLAFCKTAVSRAQCSPDFVRLEEASFRECPSESIDYAIMEKTSRAAVVPASFGWSDVGSWGALWQISPKDERGNVLSGDVLAADTSGSFVRSEGLLIATLGVKDLVIVETGDAVLVASREQAQEIKSIVERLKNARRREHLNHLRVDRPWGSFKAIESGPGYLVKRLSVKPGAALSLQMHKHRAEHWVIAEGEAEVTLDSKVFKLREHESVDIPRGAKHRLRNVGSAVLEVIEVQTGPHLSEDDIVRFEDVYRRPVSSDV